MSEQCPTSPEGYPSDCEILEGYRTRVREKENRQMSPERQRVLTRAAEIKLLLLDVDGVLTDGNLLYSGVEGESAVESKSFNTQDGFGLRLLKEADIACGVITARTSSIVERRCRELRMEHIHQGAKNKNEAFRQILRETGLKPFQVAYMGDDWLDLVLLQQVGLAFAPANGVDQVKEVAHYICSKSGGAGAVREACEILLEGCGLLKVLLQKYGGR